jgi:Ca-activated chloride channel family protein
VLELALTDHLLSPYTSPVAIDVTPVRRGDQSLETHALKTNLPQDLDYAAVFGLGQGATEAPAHVALGLVALGLAAALADTALRTRKIGDAASSSSASWPRLPAGRVRDSGCRSSPSSTRGPP